MFPDEMKLNHTSNWLIERTYKVWFTDINRN